MCGVFLLIYLTCLGINIYKAVGMSWKIVKSNHRMYDECQHNPEHRERYYSSCLLLEGNGNQPSTFYVDVLTEASRHIYPLVFFEFSDISTFRGLAGMVAMVLCQRFLKEVVDFLLQTNNTNKTTTLLVTKNNTRQGIMNT